MNLRLVRFILGPRATIGALYIDGRFEAFICEDTYRGDAPKVPKETAIPCGTYEVEITHSPRFGVPMPLVKNVPGFTGIRIHWGNTPEDTDGCPLIGRTASADGVQQSRVAYDAFFAKLSLAGGKATLAVELMTHST